MDDQGEESGQSLLREGEAGLPRVAGVPCVLSTLTHECEWTLGFSPYMVTS